MVSMNSSSTASCLGFSSSDSVSKPPFGGSAWASRPNVPCSNLRVQWASLGPIQTMPFINDDSPIEMLNTSIIMSDSLNCSSSAAEMSSFAIANPTTSDTSPPIPARRSVGDGILGGRDLGKFATEGYDAEPVFEYQKGTVLCVAKLLCPGSKGSGSVSRKGCWRDRCYPHRGYVYGCVASNVLAYACGELKTHRTCDAEASMMSRAATAAIALATCRGHDTHRLIQGVKLYGIHGAQRRPLASRVKHKRRPLVAGECIVSISLALVAVLDFVSRHSQERNDLSDIAEELFLRAIAELSSWHTNARCSDSTHALHAELRCLRRGQLALRALRIQNDIGVIHKSAWRRVQDHMIFLQLAMWPPGADLSEETQPGVCEWIMGGAFASTAQSIGESEKHPALLLRGSAAIDNDDCNSTCDSEDCADDCSVSGLSSADSTITTYAQPCTKRRRPFFEIVPATSLQSPA